VVPDAALQAALPPDRVLRARLFGNFCAKGCILWTNRRLPDTLPGPIETLTLAGPVRAEAMGMTKDGFERDGKETRHMAKPRRRRKIGSKKRKARRDRRKR
jgi:hypothetical protein